MNKNSAENQPINFGISSWSYPWASGVAKGPQPKNRMTPFDLIQKAADLGVKLVQFADNMPLENLSEIELIQLKSLADSNNIKIEVGTKGLDFEHLMRFLEIALLLGSPIVRTLPALFGKKAVMDEVESLIKKALPRYAEAEIILTIENTEAFKAAEYAALIERINHPNFRICLDLANAIGILEGPEYVMSQLGKYCANYHFKDVTVIRSATLMGFSVEGRSSGNGSINLPWALSELKKCGNFTSVIIELWPTMQESLEETLLFEEEMVRESVKYMKTICW